MQESSEPASFPRGGTPRAGWRSTLQTVALVLFGLVAGCLVLEVGFRVWGRARGIDHRLFLQELTRSNTLAIGIWGPPDQGPLNTIAERAFQRYPPLKPRAEVLATTSDYSVIYRINSKGLRDREYDYDKPANVTRVLLFGDSFAFGTGVAQEETIADVAEGRLDRVEILNMGVPGYGLDQILLSFLAQGIRYHPDLVVVLLNSHVTGRHRTGIVEGDAVRIPDRLEAVEFVGESGGTAYVAPDDPLWARHRHWLVRHCYACAFLTYRLQVRRLQKSLEGQDEIFWKKQRRLNRTRGLQEDPDTARRRRTIALLHELQRAVEGAGARLLVLNIDQRVAMAFLGREPGLDVVDLAPDLAAGAKTAPLTFTYDQHYNAGTNRSLGERLAGEVRRRLDAAAAERR